MTLNEPRGIVLSSEVLKDDSGHINFPSIVLIRSFDVSNYFDII